MPAPFQRLATPKTKEDNMNRLIVAAAFVALLAGCQTQPTTQTAAPVEDRSAAAAPRRAARAPRAPAPAASPARSRARARARPGNPLRDPSSVLSKRVVYFDFDSFTVRDEFRPLIEAHGRYLAQNRNARMTIQGNTDERGSREYNIALGQKRADAVKRMMTLLGAQDSQIETVSFGKEKPKNAGHDEASWAENRATTSSTRASDARARLAVLALAFAASAASAALFDDDEARKRIADTNVRLTQVQAQLEARSRSSSSSFARRAWSRCSHGRGHQERHLAPARAARGAAVRARGGAEAPARPLRRPRLAHPQARDRGRRAARRRSARGRRVPEPPPAPPRPTARPSSASTTPRSSSSSAPTTTGRSRRSGPFVRTHARSPLAPSAQYWLGNAQFAKRDFRSAITAQRMLIQVYPDSAKVPDALLNISSAQAELNDNAAARRTLEELIAKYPTSEAAGKARQRLGVR
jgi:peptidoglycan-associated lipoprotein